VPERLLRAQLSDSALLSCHFHGRPEAEQPGTPFTALAPVPARARAAASAPRSRRDGVFSRAPGIASKTGVSSATF
jgi:hypothetical protein